MAAEAGGPERPLDPGARGDSPFVTIWEAPRATIRRLVATDPRRHVNALFFAAGVVGTLAGVARSADQLPTPPLAILPLAALALGALNVPFGHLNALYKRWVGGLLGGTASRAAVATVGAWSTVPMTMGHGALLILQVLLYGAEPFGRERPTMDDAAPLVGLSIQLASAACTIWTVAVSVVGFAEVNGFSVWRSIATSLLGLLILATAMVVLAVAMGAGAGWLLG